MRIDLLLTLRGDHARDTQVHQFTEHRLKIARELGCGRGSGDVLERQVSRKIVEVVA
jgi:hypothetical protein